MRKMVICFLLFSTCFVCGHKDSSFSYEPVDCYKEVDWDLFMEAVIWKESRGNDRAIGDNGKAVGCLQIWPIMVKEANRLSGSHYTLNDRYDRDKSKEIFMTIQRGRNADMSLDRALRLWNGRHPNSYSDAIRAKYEELYWQKYNRYRMVYGI